MDYAQKFYNQLDELNQLNSHAHNLELALATDGASGSRHSEYNTIKGQFNSTMTAIDGIAKPDDLKKTDIVALMVDTIEADIVKVCREIADHLHQSGRYFVA